MHRPVSQAVNTATSDAQSVTPFWSAALIAGVSGLLALMLRCYFVTHAHVLQPVDESSLRGDAIQYYRYAWNLLHRHVFSSTSSVSLIARPNSFRDPGYPALMAVVMGCTRNFSAFYTAMLLVQASLGAATVSIIVMAARDWLPRSALVIAAVLIAVWPHSVSITLYLLSETWLGFLCACAMMALSWASKRPSTARLTVAGLLFGVAALTNAVVIPFASLLAAFLWLRKTLGTQAAMALALASLALPLSWGMRSLTLPPGDSATSRAITNFVQGSWPTYHVAFKLAIIGDADSKDQLRGMQYEMDLLRKDPAAGLSLMQHRMSQLPWPYLRWYLGKPRLLWDWDIQIGQGDIYVYETVDSPFAKGGPLAPLETVCFLLNTLIMLLAAVGAAVALIGQRRNAFAIACACLALFVTLVYSVLQSEPRYSIPFRGIEMLLAAGGATWIVSRFRKRGTTDNVKEENAA